MPNLLYTYTAVSPQGQRITGEESAVSEQELAKLLHQKGLIVTSMRAKGQSSFFRIRSPFSLSFGVSQKEKMMFVRNLKVMVGAGVPLPRALDILSQQTENRAFSNILVEVKNQVLKGYALSQAMEERRSIFPELFRNMIKVGEESGTLEQVLSQLALQLEKQYEIKSKVIGALIYPMVVVTAMVGIGVLMLIVVIPQLAKTFEDLGADLPLTTRLIIGLGKFLSERWYLALGIGVALGFAAWRAFHTTVGKELFDQIILRVPLIGGIVKKTYVALTLRTLSSLMASGIPIVYSLEITSNVMGNNLYKRVLGEAALAVAKGAKVSETIIANPSLYSPLAGQMMEVGEETGATSEVLGKLADFFEDEVTQVTKNLTSLIEPILMLIIGAAVGFFAISMLQPMYSLLNSLQTQ